MKYMIFRSQTNRLIEYWKEIAVVSKVTLKMASRESVQSINSLERTCPLAGNFNRIHADWLVVAHSNNSEARFYFTDHGT